MSASHLVALSDNPHSQAFGSTSSDSVRGKDLVDLAAPDIVIQDYLQSFEANARSFNEAASFLAERMEQYGSVVVGPLKRIDQTTAGLRDWAKQARRSILGSGYSSLQVAAGSLVQTLSTAPDSAAAYRESELFGADRRVVVKVMDEALGALEESRRMWAEMLDAWRESKEFAVGPLVLVTVLSIPGISIHHSSSVFSALDTGQKALDSVHDGWQRILDIIDRRLCTPSASTVPSGSDNPGNAEIRQVEKLARALVDHWLPAAQIYDCAASALIVLEPGSPNRFAREASRLIPRRLLPADGRSDGALVTAHRQHRAKAKAKAVARSGDNDGSGNDGTRPSSLSSIIQHTVVLARKYAIRATLIVLCLVFGFKVLRRSDVSNGLDRSAVGGGSGLGLSDGTESVVVPRTGLSGTE